MKLANIVPNGLNKLVDKSNDIHLLLLHWARQDQDYYDF